jgi:hypothetical protein
MTTHIESTGTTLHSESAESQKLTEPTEPAEPEKPEVPIEPTIHAPFIGDTNFIFTGAAKSAGYFFE